MTSGGLLLPAIDLLHEVPVKYAVSEKIGASVEIRFVTGGSRFSEMVLDILDEVLLILGRSVDGRTLSGLGLLTTGCSEPGTGEDTAECGHSELMRR